MNALKVTIAGILSLLLQSAYAQQTPLPEAAVPGVRLAISLTNSVLVPGSVTLLRCWITNSSPKGLVIEKSPGEGSPEEHRFEVWLRAESGDEYVLIPGPGDAGSRMAEAVRVGETRRYNVPLPIATNIPPGRYSLRAKRQLTYPGRPRLFSNTLEVQVEPQKPGK